MHKSNPVATQGTQCEVCLTPINPIHRGNGAHSTQDNTVICQSFECKRVIDQRSTMAPMLYRHHLEFQRKLIQQRREEEVAHKAHIDKVKRNEQQENHQVLLEALERDSSLRKDSLQIVTIPSGKTTLTPLLEPRKKKYIQYLESIINKAATYDNAAEVPPGPYYFSEEKREKNESAFSSNTELKAVTDKLCAMCKGGCCADGKEHAYLTVKIIRRTLDTNPELTAEELLASYVSTIAEESVKGSCINQTKTGCALPRELRSDTCNGYYCDSLTSLINNTLLKGHVDTVLTIQRSNHCWNRFDTSQPNNITNINVINTVTQKDID